MGYLRKPTYLTDGDDWTALQAAWRAESRERARTVSTGRLALWGALGLETLAAVKLAPMLAAAAMLAVLAALALLLWHPALTALAVAAIVVWRARRPRPPRPAKPGPGDEIPF